MARQLYFLMAPDTFTVRLLLEPRATGALALAVALAFATATAVASFVRSSGLVSSTSIDEVY